MSLRRLFFAQLAAASTLPYLIVAPATVQEDSPTRFQAGTNLSYTLQRSSDTAGSARIYAHPGYIGGQGGYIVNGIGEEFYFRGHGFELSGLANPDGSYFEVFVNGASIGFGSSIDPQERQKIYFDSGAMPYDTYHVVTVPRSGYAYFIDQLRTY